MSARAELWRTWERAQVALADVGGQLETAAAAVIRWAEPRERALRQRRAARAGAIGLGVSTAALASATVVVAVHPVASWAVASSAGLTALVAVPTAAAVVHLRSLYRQPLPAPGPAATRRPGRGSLAYVPLRQLGQGERSLAELLGLLERDPAVPATEVDHARAAAGAAGAALRQEAAALVALERARDTSPTAAAELDLTVRAAGGRLAHGVLGYDRLVAAAARAVAVAASADPEPQADSMAATVDRVDALTAALVELAQRHVPPY